MLNSQCFFLLVFLIIGCRQTTAQLSEGVPCETPDGQSGACINIKNCTKLLNLLVTQSQNETVQNFLRSSTCGFVDKSPIVCCPPETNTPDLEKDDRFSRNQNLINLEKAPKCGMLPSTTRIVNGRKASLGQFPYMVALGYRNVKNPELPRWLCGGTLITRRHILTAAHCVRGRSDLYLARIGELTFYDDKDGANPEDIPLKSATVHEDFSPVLFTNDIAILTLQREPTNPNITLVCLPFEEPQRSYEIFNRQGIVVGWGSIYYDGPSSDQLQVTTLPIVKNELCERAYGTQSVIDSRVMCAGYLDGRSDACKGDSGGPLLYPESIKEDLFLYQYGVVSYGFRCAEPGYPGIYTRVTHFIDWIMRNLKE